MSEKDSKEKNIAKADAEMARFSESVKKFREARANHERNAAGEKNAESST